VAAGVPVKMIAEEKAKGTLFEMEKKEKKKKK
jgi:hypothetical protein